MECAQVSLALHVHVLHLPLGVISGWEQSCVAVVTHRMPEVIQGQVVDFESVALCAEAQLVRCRDVVELSVVAGCHGLEAIAEEVAIELHQEAD